MNHNENLHFLTDLANILVCAAVSSLTDAAKNVSMHDKIHFQLNIVR